MNGRWEYLTPEQGRAALQVAIERAKDRSLEDEERAAEWERTHPAGPADGEEPPRVGRNPRRKR